MLQYCLQYSTKTHDVRRPHGPDRRPALARCAPFPAPPWLFLGSPEGPWPGAFSHTQSCPCQAVAASKESHFVATSADTGRLWPSVASLGEPHQPQPSNKWLIWRELRLFRGTVQHRRITDENRDRQWAATAQAHHVGMESGPKTLPGTHFGRIFC